MFVLGIHPDGEYFKVALLSRRGRRIQIEFLEEFKKNITNLNQLKRRLEKSSSKKIGRGLAASALSNSDVFFKNIKLPFTAKSAISKALPFQIESIPAFSKQGIEVVPLIRVKKKQSEVTLFSFTEDAMESCIRETKMLGFDPHFVSTSAQALLRFTEFFAAQKKQFLTFNFGWETSSLVLIHNEKVEAVAAVKVGLKQIIDAVKCDYPLLNDLDYTILQEKLKAAQKGTEAHKAFESIQKQVERAKKYFDGVQKDGLAGLEGILFTGYIEMARFFSEHSSLPTLPNVDIAPHLQYNQQQILSYAIEIGLALDVLQNDDRTLQLRVGRFTPPVERRAVRNKMWTFGIVSSVATLLAVGTLQVFFSGHEKAFKERVSSVANLAGKKTEDYRALTKTITSERDYHKVAIELTEELRRQSLQGLRLLEPVKVSSLLPWILSKVDQTIQIDAIEYNLISHPHLDNRQGVYRGELKIRLLAEEKECVDQLIKALTDTPKQIKIVETPKKERLEDGYLLKLLFEEIKSSL